MLTEDEAREKWCPFSRVPETTYHQGEFVGAASANRFTAIRDECNCIASDCMAWRWEWSKAFRDEDRNGKKRAGYCGLSGEPK